MIASGVGVSIGPLRVTLDTGDSGDLLLRLVLTVLVLALTVLVANGARAISRRATRNARWDLQLVLLVGRLVYLGVVTVGLLTAASILVPNLIAPLLGVVGLLGLAFGLAFQDVLKNFLSGVFLLLERPFRIGDEIKIAEFGGRVETIRLRVTVIKSADNQMILLPNQQVYTSAIVNATGYDTRQYVSVVRVPEPRPLKGLLPKAKEEVLKAEGVAEQPQPVVSLVPHIEFGPTLEARYWIEHRGQDAKRIQREINARLLHLVGQGGVLDSSELDDESRPAPARRRPGGKGTA